MELSEDERYLLKEYLKTSPLQLIRCKAQAVLMKNKGICSEDIGDILSRSSNAINRWIRDWKKRRMASIFTGHKDNQNASKLTTDQKNDIASILQKPPSEYGLSKEFWDVPTLKSYVQAKFGAVYESAQSYHFLLKFSKLSFKYPDTFDHRRNEKEIMKRMAEIRNEIQPYLMDHQWEVFVSDEVRIELETHARKAWLKRGERTILKVNRDREAQNYIGLLNQKNFKCHVFEMPWQNQDEVLKALKQFLYLFPQNKKICIIWDNARFHKGQKIKDALKKGGILQRVHLINLPPYAPDKNPIERVWNVAKKSILNKQFALFQQTKDAFSAFIQSRKFSYLF